MPTVNRNGTHPDELLEGYSLATSAILDAIKVLQEGSPNGRDYPTQEALDSALAQHAKRCSTLTGIADEMVALAEHVHATRGNR